MIDMDIAVVGDAWEGWIRGIESFKEKGRRESMMGRSGRAVG